MACLADGTVKVLDFGLAKALAPHGTSATAGDLMNSRTTTSPMTQMGMILGTAAGKLMSVAISTANGKVAVGQPVALFDLPPAPQRALGSEYDVAPNGQFLFNAPVGNQAPTAVVTLNWKAGLRK